MKKVVISLCLISLILLCFFVESKTGWVQSRVITKYLEGIDFTLSEGPQVDIYYPKEGPLNERYGYTRVGEWISKLKDYAVKAQAKLSPKHLKLVNSGINPVYEVKDSVGTQIYDSIGQPLYDKTPTTQFQKYEDIPDVLIAILLFIENKELLNSNPNYNPAIEIDRLARATVTYVLGKITHPKERTAGGSTLATQMEKYSFSKDGKTNSGSDKIYQLISASLRAYQDGPTTYEARKKIILKYFNTMPLGASPNFGEVYGYGEALKAFYGVELADEITVLNQLFQTDQLYSEEQLAALNRALQLIISVRNPSYLSKPEKLKELKTIYVKILVENNIIRSRAFDTLSLFQSKQTPELQKKNFVENKAQDLIRKKVSKLLKLDYQSLDKLDLKVYSTIRNDIQVAATDFFAQLKDEEFINEHNLKVPKLLDRTDPQKVTYSFNLFELQNGQAKLRAIYDNMNQPFSFNDSSKLELGSSAKMRVLVTYLDAMSKAFEEKQNGKLVSEDSISQFVREFNSNNLEELLEASIERKFSASPNEPFFTGGGLHKFANYNDEDDGKVVTIKEALMRSINLPFVRTLREVVQFYKNRNPNFLDKKDVEVKKELLNEFVDKESRVFLVRYFKFLKNKKVDDLDQYVTFELTKGPIGAAAVINYLHPNFTDDEVFESLATYYTKAHSPKEIKAIKELHKNFQAGIFDINDIGYLAKLHPILLYITKAMINNKDITLTELIKESYDVRIESYEWLFKTRHINEQYKRVDIVLESQAFQMILQQWLDLGYPFETIVPSLATALGSSGDKPIALAHLVGILLNDGKTTEDVSVEKYHFAKSTPYEAILERKPFETSKQIIRPEVAKVARKALQNVVEGGTAVRMRGVYDPMIVGGKTGTGDNRLELHDSAGNMTESTPVNRTSTFVFYIGERWFGSITIYVDKDEAEHSTFTSSLAVGLMNLLSQEIKPIIFGEY